VSTALRAFEVLWSRRWRHILTQSTASATSQLKGLQSKPNYDHRVREAVPMIDLIGSCNAAFDKKAREASRIMIIGFVKRFR
jgi:hypothetical protein